MLHAPFTASVDINAVRNPFAPSWMLLDPSSRRIILSNQQSWIPVLMTQHSLTCSVLHGGLLSLSLPMGTLAVVRVLIQELILLFTLSCLSNPSQQCAHLSTSTYRIAARSRRRTMKRADHLSRDPAHLRSVSFTTPFSCPFFSQCTKYALKRGITPARGGVLPAGQRSPRLPHFEYNGTILRSCVYQILITLDTANITPPARKKLFYSRQPRVIS